LLHTHFTVVASHTWQTLRDATEYRISQGEETITDNLLLYLLRQKLPNLRLIKTPKDKEVMMGTDWEWWIGSRALGFVRYAVQAKKLNPETHRYHKLRHEISTPRGPEQQDLILRRYADANAAIPLYALYNYLDLPDFKDYWNCPLPLDIEQFGVTVTPLANIQRAIATRGCRSFESLHSCDDTVPLRCLLVCRRLRPRASADGSLRSPKFRSPIKLYSADDIGQILNSNRQELGEFPTSLYNKEIGIYPRHIVVAETDA
jgi:hypothetical protein